MEFIFIRYLKVWLCTFFFVLDCVIWLDADLKVGSRPESEDEGLFDCLDFSPASLLISVYRKSLSALIRK